MKHVFSCLHPKVFKNKDGQLQTVPCGKCVYCQNMKQSSLLDRIMCDCKSFKYTAFVTLTYEEQYVPKAYLLDDFISFPGHEVLDPSFVQSFQECQLSNEDFIRVLHYPDLQKFIKRLRNIYAKRNSGENIRYFAVGEYGKRFRRPHYHLLLMFNSDSQAASMEEDISACWKFGFHDLQFADTSASKYVAKYVNKSDNLPSFYQYEQIRQKCLFSKSPALGVCSLSSSKIKEIFDTSAHEICIPARSQNRSSCYVPLWRSIQDRLFPKIKGFNRLNHDQRIAIYSIYKDFHLIQDVTDFESYYREGKDRNNYIDQCLSLAGFNDFDSPFYSSTEFRSLFYQSRRVCLNADYFGMSINAYVSKIEQFYNELEALNLAEQMKYLQNLSYSLVETGTPEHDVLYNLMFVYSIFVEYLLYPESVKDHHLMIDFLFGEDPDQCVSDFDFRKSLDYKGVFSTHVKIKRDSVRSKYQKSYVNCW